MKSYTFIDGTYVASIEVKRSKFIATAYGEADAESAEAFVSAIKKKYPDAKHNCYAYLSDTAGQATRFSDDGEPGGTAGQPILKILKTKGITRSVIVVTRYFGGIKLGTGGLVQAYTEVVQKAVDMAATATKTECVKITVKADYNLIASITGRLKKEGISNFETDYSEGVILKTWVPTDYAENIITALNETTAGKIEAEADYSVSEFKRI